MKVSCNFYLKLSGYIYQANACVFSKVTQSCSCQARQLLHGLPNPHFACAQRPGWHPWCSPASLRRIHLTKGLHKYSGLLFCRGC